jgi:hypothetical protein
MKLLSLILLGVLLLGQTPSPPVNFPQVNRKARALTADELGVIKRLNEEFELFARRVCESIDVKYSECAIENGVVAERIKPPVVPQSEVPARKPEKPTEPAKPPVK